LKQADKHDSAEEKVALLRHYPEKGGAAFDRGSSHQTTQLQQQMREME